MPRKTRKHSAPQSVQTIPQLRRLFEKVESFVDDRIVKHVSKETLVKEFRKEWKQLFMRDLDKSAADAFIDARMKSKKILRHTRKQRGGGPIAGAPLDYTTRPGIYLQPGQIPGADGSLPTMDGGGYGNYINYVNQGFWNPEDSQTFDPVIGQTPWPQPYATTGSNLMGGGAAHSAIVKRSRKKIRGGAQLLSDTGALLTQAFTRPFPSSVPANVGQDMQSMFYGGTTGPSPDQVGRHVAEVPLPPYKTPQI